MSNVSLWLSIIASGTAILGFIYKIIKNYLENHNVIIKDKNEEINDIVDDRYNEDELQCELINSYSMIGANSKITNQILSKFDMDNVYEENILKKGFRKSRLKLDVLLLLIKNQVKGYGKPGDLSDKIKKTKNELIEQIGKDLDAIMETNYIGLMHMFNCSEESLVLGKRAFLNLRNFGLRKIDNLFNSIIEKICL